MIRTSFSQLLKRSDFLHDPWVVSLWETSLLSVCPLWLSASWLKRKNLKLCRSAFHSEQRRVRDSTQHQTSMSFRMTLQKHITFVELLKTLFDVTRAWNQSTRSPAWDQFSECCWVHQNESIVVCKMKTQECELWQHVTAQTFKTAHVKAKSKVGKKNQKRNFFFYQDRVVAVLWVKFQAHVNSAIMTTQSSREIKCNLGKTKINTYNINYVYKRLPSDSAQLPELVNGLFWGLKSIPSLVFQSQYLQNLFPHKPGLYHNS